MSLKAQLQKHKALWNKAKEAKQEFDNVVTAGVYVGKLVKANLNTSESSGRLQVAFAAVISGGEFKGEKVNWWSGLKTEQNFMYLQRDLTRLGAEVPTDINDLEDILAEVEKEKPAIRFKVSIDGEFTNVRILKKLNADETPESEEEDVTAEAEVPEDVEPEAEEAAPTKGKKAKKSEPEEEIVEEETEEVVEDAEPTLEAGVRVAFDFQKEELVGEVVSVEQNGEKAIVQSDAGKKYKIKVENLRPAPKAKVKKR